LAKVNRTSGSTSGASTAGGTGGPGDAGAAGFRGPLASVGISFPAGGGHVSHIIPCACGQGMAGA
jgi:hypothetical protein